MSKTSTLLGAGIGLAVFAAVGLLPALLYGGYAGVMLAGGIMGTPILPTLATKAMIVGGMVLGFVSVAFLFMVLGAVAGAAAGVLLRGAERVTSNA